MDERGSTEGRGTKDLHRPIRVIHRGTVGDSTSITLIHRRYVLSTTSQRFVTSLCTALDRLDQFRHLVVYLSTLLHESRDLLDCVHHGRMVPSTKFSCYRGIGEIRQFTKYIHSDLSCYDKWTSPAHATEIGDGETERGSSGVENYLRGDTARLLDGDDVGKHLFRQITCQRLMSKAPVRTHPYQSTLSIPGYCP